MVLPDSHRISRVPWYLGFDLEPARILPTGLSPSLAGLSRPFGYLAGFNSFVVVPRPRRWLDRRFRLIPVRSPLLGESRLISFPPGTEMFQFPTFASTSLCIQLEDNQV